MSPGNAPTSSSVCAQFKVFFIKKTRTKSFQAQLNNLMRILAATSPHFIRCVKPNVEKLPNVFDDKLVSAQLR